MSKDTKNIYAARHRLTRDATTELNSGATGEYVEITRNPEEHYHGNVPDHLKDRTIAGQDGKLYIMTKAPRTPEAENPSTLYEKTEAAVAGLSSRLVVYAGATACITAGLYIAMSAGSSAH
jgi:hypothetical protein